MTQAEGRASWADLFSASHRGVAIVLAGGVAMYASNVYLTASLLPSAVAQIGGAEFYAWSMSGFMVASVITSLFVRRAIDRWGTFGAYASAVGTFAIGSAVCAIAPAMSVFLLGRVIQGLGGGLLTGLGMALVRVALPPQLWARAIGLVSAMWGVGNILGPLLGGLLAQLGAWRWAFWLLVVAAGALVVVAKRSLPRRAHQPSEGRIPFASLVVLTLSVLCVSLGSVFAEGWAQWLLLAAAAAALVVFVLVDRTARNGVLPAFTYTRRSPLKWVYIGISLLVIGTTIETYVPMFGQRLGGMSPLVAGLLGAALSWGWSVGGIFSASVSGPALKAGLRMLGPVVLGLGLIGYGVLQVEHPSFGVLAGWFVVLFLGGVGIGIAFVHNLTAAMGSSDDAEEAMQASAGSNVVQIISTGIGAAVAGLIVNVSAGGGVGASARVLAVCMGVFALAGALPVLGTLRRQDAPRGRARDERAADGGEEAA